MSIRGAPSPSTFSDLEVRKIDTSRYEIEYKPGSGPTLEKITVANDPVSIVVATLLGITIACD